MLYLIGMKGQVKLTSLAGDDHGLHDKGEEFIQHSVEEKDQGL